MRKGTKWIVVIIVMIMAISIVTTKKVSAETKTYTQSTDGKWLYYVDTDDRIIIKPRTVDSNPPENVVIPAEVDGYRVKAVEEQAYAFQFKIKTLTIEEGVEELKTEAFLRCKSLTEVKFPNSLRKIGKNCFQNCVRLGSIDTMRVTTIEEGAFQCTEQDIFAKMEAERNLNRIEEYVTSIGLEHKDYQETPYNSVMGINVGETITQTYKHIPGTQNIMNSIKVTYECISIKDENGQDINFDYLYSRLGFNDSQRMSNDRDYRDKNFSYIKFKIVKIEYDMEDMSYPDGGGGWGALKSITLRKFVKSLHPKAFSTYYFTSMYSKLVNSGVMTNNRLLDICEMINYLPQSPNIKKLQTFSISQPTNIKYGLPQDTYTIKDTETNIPVNQTEFDVSYSSTDVGLCTMTVTPKAESLHEGIATKTFEIEKALFNENVIDVVLSGAVNSGHAAYTGESIKPTYQLEYKGIKLVEGVDYTITQDNNLYPGTARITFKGNGSRFENTSFSVNYIIDTVPFTEDNVKITFEKEHLYTGTEIYPHVLIIDKRSGLEILPSRANIQYKNNKDIGEGTITITGSGNFYSIDTLTYKFNIVQQLTSPTPTPNTGSGTPTSPTPKPTPTPNAPSRNNGSDILISPSPAGINNTISNTNMSVSSVTDIDSKIMPTIKTTNTSITNTEKVITGKLIIKIKKNKKAKKYKYYVKDGKKYKLIKSSKKNKLTIYKISKKAIVRNKKYKCRVDYINKSGKRFKRYTITKKAVK